MLTDTYACRTVWCGLGSSRYPKWWTIYILCGGSSIGLLSNHRQRVRNPNTFNAAVLGKCTSYRWFLWVCTGMHTPRECGVARASKVNLQGAFPLRYSGCKFHIRIPPCTHGERKPLYRAYGIPKDNLLDVTHVYYSSTFYISTSFNSILRITDMSYPIEHTLRSRCRQ